MLKRAKSIQAGGGLLDALQAALSGAFPDKVLWIAMTASDYTSYAMPPTWPLRPSGTS